MGRGAGCICGGLRGSVASSCAAIELHAGFPWKFARAAGQDGHGGGGVARNLSLTLHLGGEERFPRGHGCGAACADPCARFSIDLALFGSILATDLLRVALSLT